MRDYVYVVKIRYQWSHCDKSDKFGIKRRQCHAKIRIKMGNGVIIRKIFVNFAT